MPPPRAWWSRRSLEMFLAEAGRAAPPGSLVLDAGAGDTAHRKFFSHCRYESADFGKAEKRYGSLTYVCDLTAIPVDDGRFDMIVCTQTLEHLPEPKAALAELYRVVKPGGQLWLSAPFSYHEHEIPYDFYRYTQYGLRHLLGAVGFEVRRVEWLSGYYSTLAYQLRLASHSLPLNPRKYGGGVVGVGAGCLSYVLRPTFRVLSEVFARLGARAVFTGAGLCINYAAVAVRPPAAARVADQAASGGG